MSSLNDYISVFNNSIPSDLQLIIETLVAHNKKVYIVGGAVRDCLLGFPVKDFDIATNTKPTQIEELLNRAGIKTKPFGSRYGTVLAISGKKAFHLSTFRQEKYSASSELLEVLFVDSLEEDLAIESALLGTSENGSVMPGSRFFRRRKPFARIAATSFRRSSGVISSGSQVWYTASLLRVGRASWRSGYPWGVADRQGRIGTMYALWDASPWQHPQRFPLRGQPAVWWLAVT